MKKNPIALLLLTAAMATALCACGGLMAAAATMRTLPELTATSLPSASLRISETVLTLTR